MAKPSLLDIIRFLPSATRETVQRGFEAGGRFLARRGVLGQIPAFRERFGVEETTTQRFAKFTQQTLAGEEPEIDEDLLFDIGTASLGIKSLNPQTARMVRKAVAKGISQDGIKKLIEFGERKLGTIKHAIIELDNIGKFKTVLKAIQPLAK